MSYSYHVVETALAMLFCARTARQRLTFKARLTHLQKLRVLDMRPGKGQALQYELQDVWKWLFCLELAEFNVPPAIAAGLAKAFWARALLDIFKHAASRKTVGKDVCLWLPGTTLMSSAWHRKADRFPGVPEIGSINPSDPSDLKVLLDWLQKGDQPRLCILNLSARLRALDAALAAAQEKRTSRTRSRPSTVRPKRPVIGSRRPTVPAFA